MKNFVTHFLDDLIKTIDGKPKYWKQKLSTSLQFWKVKTHLFTAVVFCEHPVHIQE